MSAIATEFSADEGAAENGRDPRGADLWLVLVSLVRWPRGRTLLLPDIMSIYYARSDMKSFLKHNWSNGVWAILAFQYSRIMPVSWRHLVPLAFALGLLGSDGLALVWRSGLWMLIGIVGVYVGASVTASMQVAVKERDIRYLAIMPIVFAGFHLGYGLGSVWGLTRVVAHLISRLFCKWDQMTQPW